MLRQSGHEYIETIKRYFHGCNTGNFEEMVSTFTPDVVHYFVDHSAVRGANSLANYWIKVGPRTAAHWNLDHALVQETEAVIEWSMQWTPPATERPEVLRGSEWYYFQNSKIAEIRSYHANYFLAKPDNRELWDFDYDGRGYTPKGE